MRGTQGFRVAKFAILLAGLLAAGLPASAGEEVPFRGVVRATVVNVEPVADGLLLTVSGTGQATHLGRFTRTEVLTLYADGTLDGTIDFTAANGDQLFVDVSGGFTSATTAAGTATITGGTGRFDGATGGYDWSGSTLDGIHFLVFFDGTIDF